MSNPLSRWFSSFWKNTTNATNTTNIKTDLLKYTHFNDYALKNGLPVKDDSDYNVGQLDKLLYCAKNKGKKGEMLEQMCGCWLLRTRDIINLKSTVFYNFNQVFRHTYNTDEIVKKSQKLYDTIIEIEDKNTNTTTPTTVDKNTNTTTPKT